MIQLRKSEDRGHLDHGWLDTYHTFSFGEYQDEKNMGFRKLRVINEDWVGAGTGFPTHPHRNMEIVTFVLEGALEHKDSMGNGSIIRPGDVQRMSAGTGVRHSEANHSKTERVHLFQVWILPEKEGSAPSYEQKNFKPDERKDRLRLMASRDGRDGAITVHQDVEIYGSLLGTGKSLAHELIPGRHAWIQLASGELEVNGLRLGPGDGAAISQENRFELVCKKDAELLLFDLS